MHYEKAALLRDQIMELSSKPGSRKIEPRLKTVTYQKPARGAARKPAKKI